jgi:DnaJ-class molecular chaperone
LVDRYIEIKKGIMDSFQEKPKRIPFRCVVCSGFGTLKSGTLICHACGGKGYVVVDQEIEKDINTGATNEDSNNSY